jgi:hypothetical protein
MKNLLNKQPPPSYGVHVIPDNVMRKAKENIISKFLLSTLCIPGIYDDVKIEWECTLNRLLDTMNPIELCEGIIKCLELQKEVFAIDSKQNRIPATDFCSNESVSLSDSEEFDFTTSCIKETDFSKRVSRLDVEAELKSFLLRLYDNNRKLATLRLWNSWYIGVDGAVVLADALKVNTKLTTLYLFGNYIGEEGGIYLGEALAINKSISTLTINANQLGNGTMTLYCPHYRKTPVYMSYI